MPDEHIESLDEDGIPKKWKRLRWYAGIPAILLGTILAIMGLVPFCESGAWNIVQKPALAQTKVEIVKFHTTTNDNDANGKPDGHDHLPHDAAAQKITVEKNKTNIEKLTTAVTDLTGAVSQLVVVVNVDKCEDLNNGWSPYGEDCIRIYQGRIVRKIPLSETTKLRNLRKISTKVKAAVERAANIVP